MWASARGSACRVEFSHDGDDNTVCAAVMKWIGIGRGGKLERARSHRPTNTMTLHIASDALVSAVRLCRERAPGCPEDNFSDLGCR